MDDKELEGIRSDVRTLRTDLGLDLESKNKKDLGDEEKRNKNRRPPKEEYDEIALQHKT